MSTDIPSAESTTRINSTNPKYPKGYKYFLPDGFRRGKEGESIEYDHDWYALGSVIFNSHRLQFPEDINRIDLLRICFYIEAVVEKKFFGCKSDLSLLEGGPANFLRNYLQLAAKHGFGLRLEDRFWFSLKEVYEESLSM